MFFSADELCVEPTLEIIEQPQSKGFRFRYECEGKSHGGIQGVNSRKDKKSFPTVRLHGYNGSAKILVSLVTDEEVPRPHAHELIGKNCINGVCSVVVKEENPIVSFQNLSIKHITKKNVVPVLQDKLKESYKRGRTPLDAKSIVLTDEVENQIKIKAEEQSKEMQLSVVRLQFQACLLDSNGRPTYYLPPVYSSPIYDSKAPCASPLRICRMDKMGCCCTGNDEVFLLCDKVQKEDIAVRFYELDEHGQITWEAFASFDPQDVHRQYAIVFRTPPYIRTNISSSVTVHVQLVRYSDGEASDPKSFIYYPQESEVHGIHSKRKKQVHHYASPRPAERITNLGQNTSTGNCLYSCLTAEWCENYPVGFNNSNFSQQPIFNSTESSSYLLGRGMAITSNENKNLNTVNRTEEHLSDVKESPEKTDRLTLTQMLSECLQLYSSTEDVRFLISPLKSFIKNQNEDGDNSLHLSIIHKKPMAAFNLLSTLSTSSMKHLAINQLNNLQQSPLLLSVLANEIVHLKMLLECGCNIGTCTKDGETPLHVAARLDHHQCLKMMLEHGKCRLKSVINRFSYNGYTAVHEATINGNLKCLKSLVLHGADVTLRDQIAGKTALHHAVDNNYVSLVAYIVLETNADINAMAHNGITALGTAVASQQLKNVAILATVNASMDPPYDLSSRSSDESYSESDDEKDAINLCSSLQLCKITEIKDTDELKSVQLERLLKGEPYEIVHKEISSDVFDASVSIACDSGIESMNKP